MTSGDIANTAMPYNKELDNYKRKILLKFLISKNIFGVSHKHTWECNGCIFSVENEHQVVLLFVQAFDFLFNFILYFFILLWKVNSKQTKQALKPKQ